MGTRCAGLLAHARVFSVCVSARARDYYVLTSGFHVFLEEMSSARSGEGSRRIEAQTRAAVESLKAGAPLGSARLGRL